MCALGALVAIGGCRAGLRPSDVAATSRAVTDAKRDPTLPRTYLLGQMLDDRPAFPWTPVGPAGATAPGPATPIEMPLARRGPRSHPRARLVVDLLDERGGFTEFTVDTGTSISCVSTSSSAASTARRTADADCTSFKDRSTACRGTIPFLAGGRLHAASAPVLLVDRAHDLSDSTNLFGMTWMAGLALVHEANGGRWRFAPGGSIGAQPGWSEVRMEAKALPVVKVIGPGGASTFALIDTGAPTSLAERGCPCGTYRLLDTANRGVLEIRARETAPWRNLDPGGRHVTVWIGLADLESRSWVMDFSTGVWAIAPATPVLSGRLPR